MNRQHLELCSSAEWADAVRRWIIPWSLDEIDLGEQVLEIGPGPGATTAVLLDQVSQLTAVELNADLAESLARAHAGSGLRVLTADASETGLPDGAFDSAVSFTMLHHVPTEALQDKIFAEMRRLVRDGGSFAGSDSLDGEDFRALHEGDTCVPIEPAGLQSRLRAAGFSDIAVETNDYAVRFHAR